MSDTPRSDWAAKRAQWPRLAREVKAMEADIDFAPGSRAVLNLQMECQALAYCWGDLHIQLAQLASDHRLDPRLLKRLGELRGTVRAFVWSDAGKPLAPEGEAVPYEEISRRAHT